jgi:hypothetical protein
MSSPSYQLHPKVRERFEPRVSATALAEYLIGHAEAQETVVHNSRFSRPPIVAANQASLRALRAYNCDPRRDKSALRAVKETLTAKAALPDIKPKAKDEALRCIETIEMFELSENALGLKSLPLVAAPKFEELEVEGVLLSIRPDFLVRPVNGRVGAGIIRVAKAPDPADCKGDETKRGREEFRRELGRYMIAMFHMLLDKQGGKYGTPDPALSFLADVRLGERIGAGADHTARLRQIRAACRQIASQWDNVKPRKSVLKKPGK